MGKRLKPEILRFLYDRIGKESDKIRPRISEIRRESGLTLNAAAQIYAKQHGTSIMAKLDEEDRKSLATVQSVSHINYSKVVKNDKRTLNINNSPVHNLSFGDRNKVRQSVISLDESLGELFEMIEDSPALSLNEKEDYKSDLQSLASQIGKKKPNRIIIQEAWKGLQGLASVEGFVQLINRLAPLIQSLLG